MMPPGTILAEDSQAESSQDGVTDAVEKQTISTFNSYIYVAIKCSVFRNAFWRPFDSFPDSACECRF